MCLSKTGYYLQILYIINVVFILVSIKMNICRQYTVYRARLQGLFSQYNWKLEHERDIVIFGMMPDWFVSYISIKIYG